MLVRIATLLAVLALAGCGSAGAPVRTSSPSFTVTLDDYLIRPQEIRVPKGHPLTITVFNHGRLGHTFRIRRGATHVLLAITTIQPGQSKTATIKLKPGKYTMFCALANHEELGMSGKLTVR
jgi:plastocyanin